jgi:hypothetical protein
MNYRDFEEYRPPGYWLDEDDRIAWGMDPKTGEFLRKEGFQNGLLNMDIEFHLITGESDEQHI